MSSNKPFDLKTVRREVTIKYPEGFPRETFANVLGACEQAYNTHGRVPTLDQISFFCRHKKETISRILSTQEFLDSIRARGVNWELEPGLSNVQMLALNVLTNINDKRNIEQKLRSLGVTYNQYRAWMREPIFNQRVTQLGEEILKDNESNIKMAIAKKAGNGDIQAARLALELTGRLDPAQKQSADLMKVIQLLLEVITRHVTDQDTLNSISSEFNTVIRGELL